MRHPPYWQFDVQKMIYRDFLAMDRTALANERTILSYGRTCLMILATGITLIKVFSDSPSTVVLGYALIPLGLAIFAFGGLRYWRVRKAIYAALDQTDENSANQPPAPPGPPSDPAP